MKKLIAGTALLAASMTAQGAIVELASLTIDAGSVSGTPVPGFVQSLDIVDPNANILEDYTTIAVTFIGMGDQTLYTSDANLDPNGMGPAAGTVPGGPVPTGMVDTDTGEIWVDMSSMFSDHGGFDGLVGGIGYGLWNSMTGEYQMAWTVALPDPHPAAGTFVSFVFHGYASPVPVPAAAWLLGSGLIALVGVARRRQAA